MIVLKFGGSSVASATNISHVLDIVEEAASRDRVVLVCSAIAGCTDALIGGDEEELEQIRLRHEAIVQRLFTGAESEQCIWQVRSVFEDIAAAPDAQRVVFGEILSTLIVAAKLKAEGSFETLWLDSRRLVRTRGGKLDTRLTYSLIEDEIAGHKDVGIFVVPGFIASDENGVPCTLGRGGSDYTASIFAAALGADDLQIWTDVPGVMTTNPKDCPQARTVPQMSYKAAFLLAENGAKVLYAPSVLPAREAGITINIRDTFRPSHPGTRIGHFEDGPIVGIARSGNLITIVCSDEGLLDEALDGLYKAGIVAEGKALGQGAVCLETGEHEAVEAVRVLHNLFFERHGVIELFLAGHGAVGSALEKMLDPDKVALKAVAAHACDDEALLGAALASDCPRRTFVDCTDSEDIHRLYVPLLEAGVNVVSSNRRALAVPYAEFAAMKAAAARGGSELRYETTVGAALPMLSAVRLSTSRGDELLSVEAIVSCTLNYILTSEDGPAEALAKARTIGLTESDPSQDFCGKDALRKLLIIARTAGIPLEESDVEVQAVDPDSLTCGSRLRYVASLERRPDGTIEARIGLRELGEEHPASRLRGTDNAIMVRTRLHPSPTYIQGAGEGAAIAASSILDDILK